MFVCLRGWEGEEGEEKWCEGGDSNGCVGGDAEGLCGRGWEGVSVTGVLEPV